MPTAGRDVAGMARSYTDGHVVCRSEPACEQNALSPMVPTREHGNHEIPGA